MAGSEQSANEEILRRLSNIEHRVASIDETSAFAMRANRVAHPEQIAQIFRRSKRRAQIYIAANGKRTVNGIAEVLQMKQPHVSRELTYLEREGLLVATSLGAENYWNKKPIDRTLGISDYLQEHFDLSADGV